MQADLARRAAGEKPDFSALVPHPLPKQTPVSGAAEGSAEWLAEVDHKLLDSNARDFVERVFGKLPGVPGGPLTDFRCEFERCERYLEVNCPITLLGEFKEALGFRTTRGDFIRLAKVVLSRKVDLTDFMNCWIQDSPEVFCVTKQEANFKWASSKQWEMFCTHQDVVTGSKVRVPLSENTQVRWWFENDAVANANGLRTMRAPLASLHERYDHFALWDEHGMPLLLPASCSSNSMSAWQKSSG